MKFLLKIISSAAFAFLLSKILSGVRIDGLLTAFMFALALALLDAIVKPILVILTLPATIITLGLFLFVINALVILIAAKLVDGIKIDGFWWALLFSIILSIFNSAAKKIIENNTNNDA